MPSCFAPNCRARYTRPPLPALLHPTTPTCPPPPPPQTLKAVIESPDQLVF